MMDATMDDDIEEETEAEVDKVVLACNALLVNSWAHARSMDHSYGEPIAYQSASKILLCIVTQRL